MGKKRHNNISDHYYQEPVFSGPAFYGLANHADPALSTYYTNFSKKKEQMNKEPHN